MITVTDVDMSGLNAKFTRLFALIKAKPLADMLKPQARLLCISLAKYTQPFGLDKAAEKKGTDKVERDYRRVYPNPDDRAGILVIVGELSSFARPADRMKARERIWRYLASGDTTAIDKMMRDMHVPFAYAKLADKSFHDRRWKNGKLYRGPGQVVERKGSVSKLIAAAKARVGFAKSGWAAAARDLGGDQGLPKWIKNHNAPGYAVISAIGDSICQIKIVNSINYTDRVLSRSNKRAAIAEREYAIGARIDMILKARLKAAGATA